MMKPVLLQFDSLPLLAGFSKGVNDRGYVMVVKDLTLQVKLTDEELQVALQQYSARVFPINKAAA